MNPPLFLRILLFADDREPAGTRTPEFQIDEAALLTGVRAMTALVWRGFAK
jgi:hypothetical protein